MEAPDPRRWWTLIVLCLSLLMVILGNTVLNVAIPTLIRVLDASDRDVQWMVDAYSLVFAGLLFTAGALGDRFGRKLALDVGLVVFGLGSLFAALGDGTTERWPRTTPRPPPSDRSWNAHRPLGAVSVTRTWAGVG